MKPLVWDALHEPKDILDFTIFVGTILDHDKIAHRVVNRFNASAQQIRPIEMRDGENWNHDTGSN